MQKPFTLFLTFVLLAMTLPSLSSQIEIITLQDGTQVRLNKDFTWEYVIIENSSIGGSTIQPKPLFISPTPIKEIVASNNTVNHPLLSTDISAPVLSTSTTKNDIKISLIETQWDNERAGLTFELTSHSQQNYVIITLDISLYSDSGLLLKKQTVNVWQASFRLPETYLRINQIRNSRVIWIDNVDKTQWKKKLISLEIQEMKSRG